MRALFRVLAVVVVLACFSGCVSSVSADRAVEVDLKSLQSYYVAKLPADERGVERVIAETLNRHGLQATSGPTDAMPADTDVLVEYHDRWRLDMAMYMTGLKLVFRDADNKDILASGNAARSSLTRSSVSEIVDELVVAIFAQE